MSSYQEIYKDINKKFGEIIRISLDGANEKKYANLEAYYDDYLKWVRFTSGENERLIFEEANSEYRTMLLFLCMGLYKNAYMSLRGYLELTLFGIELSSSDFEFRLWKEGSKDVHWSEIIDCDKGIFSKQYVEAYNKTLVGEREKACQVAKEQYRKCSEYIHSGYKVIKEGIDVAFEQNTFNEFCSSVKQINRIITYVFCVRYKEKILIPEIKEQLQDSILDELSDIREVHEFLQ
uniref:hypothetical protein n=1 Tax=Roseburia faecis TaxID=301302 RepID=UPI004026222F